jgi:hypothetical protein
VLGTTHATLGETLDAGDNTIGCVATLVAGIAATASNVIFADSFET